MNDSTKLPLKPEKFKPETKSRMAEIIRDSLPAEPRREGLLNAEELKEGNKAIDTLAVTVRLSRQQQLPNPVYVQLLDVPGDILVEHAKVTGLIKYLGKDAVASDAFNDAIEMVKTRGGAKNLKSILETINRNSKEPEKVRAVYDRLRMVGLVVEEEIFRNDDFRKNYSVEWEKHAVEQWGKDITGPSGMNPPKSLQPVPDGRAR